jgi:hypothetical protein
MDVDVSDVGVVDVGVVDVDVLDEVVVVVEDGKVVEDGATDDVVADEMDVLVVDSGTDEVDDVVGRLRDSVVDVVTEDNVLEVTWEELDTGFEDSDVNCDDRLILEATAERSLFDSAVVFDGDVVVSKVFCAWTGMRPVRAVRINLDRSMVRSQEGITSMI